MGKELRDAANNRVFLHGVNYSGAEYACIQGWGIFDGPSDDAMISAMRSWNVNVVHLGLNEDCILGINGVPAAYAGANYMNAIVAFVDKLHAHGVYAEVSVMWAAPETQQATGHPAILDQDHSADALRAIANAFKGDPNTMIGLQSEPPISAGAAGAQAARRARSATPRSGCRPRSTPCAARARDERRHRVRDRLGEQPHPVAGLQAERSSEPTRSRGARVRRRTPAARRHASTRRWLPSRRPCPLFGEAGDTSCGSTSLSQFFAWMEAHGSGEMVWVWDLWASACGLISDFSGTPKGAYGSYVKSHYLSLP